MLDAKGKSTFAALNGKLYLLGDMPQNIYVYDGMNPPVLVKTLSAPGDTITPYSVMQINNKLYFDASMESGNGIFSLGIWSYDPTTNDVRLEYTFPQNSNYKYPILFQDKIYFQMYTPDEGVELHVFDPSTGTQNLVADINPGADHSWPDYMAVAGGMLFFRGEEKEYGRELYMYDGQNPPKRLTDIGIGPDYGVQDPWPVAHKGQIYFKGHVFLPSGSASNAIYKYDPATGDVNLVCDVQPGKMVHMTQLAVYGDVLYFGASGYSVGVELVSYDFVNPPVLVADVQQGRDSQPRNFVQYNNSLYFIGDDEIAGYELYKYTDSALSIKGANVIKKVSVYPNPANNKVNLEISLSQPETLNIVLTDINGRSIYTAKEEKMKAGKNIINIPMKGLPAGIYNYHIANTSGASYNSGSIIKE